MATEGRDQGSTPADADRDDVSQSDVPQSNRVNSKTLLLAIVLIIAAIVVLLVLVG